MSGNTKGRMTISMLLRHQIGLVCPIRLKNHIPEALQVHFTQARTQERGHGGESRSKLLEPGSPEGKWWLTAASEYTIISEQTPFTAVQYPTDTRQNCIAVTI